MATKKVAVNLDLLTNQLTNFAIENVDELSTPDTSQKGRIVFCTDDHALYLNNGSQWVKLAEGEFDLKLDGTKVKLNDNEIEFKGSDGITVTGANGVMTHTLTSVSASKITGLSFAMKGTKLQLKNGVGENDILAEMDASAFIKDGMLREVKGPYTPKANEEWTVRLEDDLTEVTIGAVEKGKTYLGFIWDTGDLSKVDAFYKTSLLDVSKLVDVYKANGGIELNGNQFSIQRDPDSEGFLTVSVNGLKLSGVQDAINAVKDDLETDINTNAQDIKYAQLSINNLNGKVTHLEADYKAADVALLGTDKDDANANTIYGVRNYATSVARLMGGFNFSKQVTSGDSLSLYANTTANATSNNASYMIDLASISVRNKEGERIEVEVRTPTASNTPAVVLSWSGITLSSSDPLIVNYRVILNQTGA